MNRPRLPVSESNGEDTRRGGESGREVVQLAATVERPLVRARPALGGRVVCETKRIWSHYFRRYRPEASRTLPHLLAQRPSLSLYSLIAATMRLCRTDYPATSWYPEQRAPHGFFQLPPSSSRPGERCPLHRSFTPFSITFANEIYQDN
jgi:hypothetical protein